MSKSRRDNRGNTREQKLLYENQRLKRQISQLRKLLARVDLDRYDNIREIIEQHYQEDRAQEGQDILEKMREEWKCRSCVPGYLEIFTYNKVNKTWYFRQCSHCENRTKAQEYTPSVKGIFKKA